MNLRQPQREGIPTQDRKTFDCERAAAITAMAPVSRWSSIKLTGPVQRKGPRNR